MTEDELREVIRSQAAEIAKLRDRIEDLEEDVAHLSRDREEEIAEAELRGRVEERERRESAREDAEWRERW